MEELEKASITRPMETRGSEASTAAGGGGGSGAASGGGGGGRARGRGRGVRGERAEEGGEEKEGEEDWRKYRECMGPLQVWCMYTLEAWSECFVKLRVVLVMKMIEL